jgi:hypothetical protein
MTISRRGLFGFLSALPFVGRAKKEPYHKPNLCKLKPVPVCWIGTWSSGPATVSIGPQAEPLTLTRGTTGTVTATITAPSSAFITPSHYTVRGHDGAFL